MHYRHLTKDNRALLYPMMPRCLNDEVIITIRIALSFESARICVGTSDPSIWGILKPNKISS